MSRILLSVPVAGLSLLVSLLGVATEAGQASIDRTVPTNPDFKIMTQVFIGKSQQPVSINHTLFHENLVFDFRFATTDPDRQLEVCIYDTYHRKFILLDMQRRMRLDLDHLQLLRILAGQKEELNRAENIKYLTFEVFSEDYQIDSNKITVANDFVSYSALGERPDDDSVLPRYYDFLDQYTLLSATDPRRMPPFARIELNRSIKKYGIMPTRVVRETKIDSGNRYSPLVSSQHQLQTKLDSNDLENIRMAKQNWTRFPAVELDTYREIEVARSASETDRTGGKR